MSQINLYEQDQSSVTPPPADGKALFLDSDGVFKAKAPNGAVTLIEASPSSVTPQPIGTPTPGVSGALSRGDHVHGHGNQGGGTEHALATESSAGFLSPQEKGVVNGYRGLAASPGIALGITTYTATTTVSNGIVTALCNATAGPMTITLAPGTATRVFNAKKIDASGNAVTVSAAPALIDGAATFVLAAQYDKVSLHFDGTNWYII